MVVTDFPPVDLADENGLLAVGGDLEVETLLNAYQRGIFPWPLGPEYPLTWFSPPHRAVLFFDRLHLPKSLQKEIKRNRFDIVINRDFEGVIRACSELTNRRDSSTWITEEMIDAYLNLFRAGYAISIEAYLENVLVGGIYGVRIKRMFAGESMFYREENASKVCLVRLVELLKAEGLTWLDCQQLTPHLEALGAVEVPRDEYLELLNKAVRD